MSEAVPGIPNMATANAVDEIKTFDPGLGAYSFENLGDLVKFSDLMSNAGEMLPDHLRRKPALCLAVTMRATHWGFDPFALAMETYQTKSGGPIGYQAKVFTAALRHAGIELEYEYEGEVTMLDQPVKSANGKLIAARKATGNRKCRAVLRKNGKEFDYETQELDAITIKNSPLWHNDPDQQLAYMAGRGWARRHRADIIMGAYSDDEVEQMPMRDVTPKATGWEDRIAGTNHVDTAINLSDLDLSLGNIDSQAWQEGFDAAQNREDFTACPYDDEEGATNWLAGFYAPRSEDADTQAEGAQ